MVRSGVLVQRESGVGSAMATMMIAARCGCRSVPAAAHSHASSLSASTASSSRAAVLVLSGALRVVTPARSRTSRSLLKGNHVEVKGVVVRALGRGNDNRDDAGVIKDMELYLDDLSLEYDSVWDTKPAWCQPWSIVGTGATVIITSWFLLHNAFLTGGATFVISLWWFSFLYAYPLAYSEMIAERRKMVEDGNEDTYGRKRVE